MIRCVAAALAMGACLLGIAGLAKPVTYQVPLDDTPAELAGPEAEVVVNNCSSCHSLDYLTTQPRAKGEQFWRDAVAKMVTVYKAPVAAEDAEAIARELGRKFG